MSHWDEDGLLGKVHDDVIARLRGCTRQSVSSARRTRGIPLPRKEFHGPSLNASVRRALSNRFEPKSAQEIYFLVLNDYGGVSQREVQRRILTMLEDGELEVDYEHCYSLTAKGQQRAGLWRKAG